MDNLLTFYWNYWPQSCFLTVSMKWPQFRDLICIGLLAQCFLFRCIFISERFCKFKRMNEMKRVHLNVLNSWSSNLFFFPQSKQVSESHKLQISLNHTTSVIDNWSSVLLIQPRFIRVTFVYKRLVQMYKKKY